jgi:glycosyltransferase involved in cell wall biosynthesis
MGTIAFLRNYYISKYLSYVFDKSFLITIKNISIPLKDKIPTDFIKVFRVFNFDYRNAGNLISNKNDVRKQTNIKSRSKFVIIFRKLADSFPTNIFIGEGGFIYIVLATLKGIRLVRKHKITHIYSSFRPMADHIIAYNIKLFFSDIKWVADFRDTVVDEKRNNVFLKNFQYWFLKKLLKKADVVTAVSHGVNKAISYTAPHVKTVRNGINELFIPYNIKEFDKFSIVYTGSLYTDLRKPVALFTSLRLLLSEKVIESESFQLIYAGKDSVIWNKWIEEYGLQSISVNMGEISMSESILLQHAGNVNLLLSWSGKSQKGVITGKIYEYFAAEKPILALINGEKDEEFEQIFSKFNAGFVFYGKDVKLIKSSIISLYNDWLKSGIIHHSFNKEKLKDYSWENRIQHLKKLIL